MHVRTCNCTVHLEFLTFTPSARVSKAFYYRQHLPSRRPLQATPRIARSGYVPAIPAVEILDFSGVIYSTHSYLTSLPVPPSRHLSAALVLSPPIPPKIRRHRSPRFGFRIWILVQESKAPLAGVAAELVHLFLPPSFAIAGQFIVTSFCTDCPVLIRSNSRNSNRIPFDQPFFFGANFVEIFWFCLLTAVDFSRFHLSKILAFLNASSPVDMASP